MMDEFLISEIKVKPRDSQPEKSEIEEKFFIPVRPTKLVRTVIQQVKFIKEKLA